MTSPRVTYTAAQLEQAGGTYWARHGLERWYFHQVRSLAGLQITYGPKRGDRPRELLRAKFGGEEVSAAEALELHEALESARVWYDQRIGALMCTGVRDDLKTRILARLAQRIERGGGGAA